ncbi:MAG: preprotein translocase subunit [Desulfovibrionaceae bacterium]|nr:MAG: preprotein translocase subunit [Desulfovibrionaceae bacterium]
MFLTSMAYAMGQPPAGADGGNQLMSFLPLVLMFVVFYFLLIRPQQKKQKETREMLKNLKRGDKVVTGGGIEGRIDAVTDDKVKVEIAPGVVITVLRAYVAGLADAAQAKKTDEKKADKPEEKK